MDDLTLLSSRHTGDDDFDQAAAKQFKCDL